MLWLGLGLELWLRLGPGPGPRFCVFGTGAGILIVLGQGLNLGDNARYLAFMGSLRYFMFISWAADGLPMGCPWVTHGLPTG